MLMCCLIQDAKVPSGHSLRRENMATSSTDGQQRPEAYRVLVSYPLARWLSEGPGEGYWHSQSRGNQDWWHTWMSYSCAWDVYVPLIFPGSNDSFIVGFIIGNCYFSYGGITIIGALVQVCRTECIPATVVLYISLQRLLLLCWIYFFFLINIYSKGFVNSC